MPRKIEKNAKSREEALELAAKEFGVSVDELSYTVEREVGKGLLGLLLGKEVIISAWVTKEAEEEERLKAERSKRREMRERKAEMDNSRKTNRDASARDERTSGSDNKERREPQKKAAGGAKRTQNPAEAAPKPRRESQARPKAKPAAEAAMEAAPEANSKPAAHDRKDREVTEQSLKDAEYFVTVLVHKMGLEDAKVDVKNGGTAIDVDVSGSRMGLLIGKRGDTLDAVQYLTGLYVNKPNNSYIKVNIDTEGYRSKREETLVKLARSLERKVLRERKSVTLEPMSPNERRIIHAALQNSEDVRTYSIGEEPNRRVVVALNR